MVGHFASARGRGIQGVTSRKEACACLRLKTDAELSLQPLRSENLPRGGSSPSFKPVIPKEIASLAGPTVGHVCGLQASREGKGSTICWRRFGSYKSQPFRRGVSGSSIRDNDLTSVAVEYRLEGEALYLLWRGCSHYVCRAAIGGK